MNVRTLSVWSGMGLAMMACVAFAQVLDVSPTPPTDKAAVAPTPPTDKATDAPASQSLTSEDDTPAAEPEQKLVTMTKEGTYELAVDNVDVRLTLQRLSTRGRRSIIISQGVTGNVTLNLYHVTLDEAIDAVLTAAELGSVNKGSFVYVYTQAEFIAMRQKETKVFRLSYIRDTSALALITPALSNEGTVGSSPEVTQEWGDNEEGKMESVFRPAEDLLVITDFPENLKEVSRILQQVDVRPPQVLIEVTIMTARLNDNTALGVNLQGSFTGLKNMKELTIDSPFNADTGSDGAPFSMTMEWSDITAVIEALEAVTDTTVVANPKLQVVNRQMAHILIGKEEGYITTIMTDTYTSETVEYLQTGTQLHVMPYIAADGFVQLHIYPEISEGAVTVPVGSTTALPNKDTTQAMTTVLCKNGNTVVVAGLFRERMKSSRSQVPVAGDIPVLGDLFGNVRDEVVREEVIILLTPHIITPFIDNAVGDHLLDEVERTRVGARKGLRWFSRTKMSDFYMQQARKAAREGDDGLVRWNVNLATYLSPKMSSAISLQEEITQQAYWTNQPKYCRTRWVIGRMLSQETGVPLETFTSPDRPLDVNAIDPKIRKIRGTRPRPKYSMLNPSLQLVEPATTPEQKPAPKPKTKTKTVPPKKASQGEQAATGLFVPKSITERDPKIASHDLVAVARLRTVRR